MLLPYCLIILENIILYFLGWNRKSDLLKIFGNIEYPLVQLFNELELVTFKAKINFMDVLVALKNLAGLAKKISDITLQQSIIDLQNSYLESQERHKEIEEKISSELIKLRNENDKLKKAFEVRANLKKMWSRLWNIEEGKIDGPFCITCWERDHQLLSLIRNDEMDAMCPVCKIKMQGTRIPKIDELEKGEN